MPKPARYTLIWFSEQDAYALYEQNHKDAPRLQSDDESWFAWLADHTSFSFQGRHGHLNLLKEARLHGKQGYWYAYHRQGKRTSKQYAGRTPDLSIARLEELAQAPGTRMGEALSLREVSQQTKDEAVPTFHLASGERTSEVSPKPVSDPTAAPLARIPLLAAKLRPPRLHPLFISRERLLALLNPGLESQLILLVAPAGYGKTMLLVEWIIQSKRPAAWISLGREENDPLHFFASLIGALQQVSPKIGQGLLTTLSMPALEALRAATFVLLHELTELPEEMMIILDNYHMIENELIRNTLVLMLDHLPTHVHLVIASRSEPLLPLARLRVSGQMTELRTSAFRFTHEEAERLLTSKMKLEVRPEELAILEQRTEGWIAGLQLVVLALQEQANFSQGIATFAENNRYILAYLLEEVFEHQSASIQSFLLQTALLESFNGALCSAVTGQADAERVLEHLAHANVFLFPHHEHAGWYRYHPLFAEALHHHLEQTHAELPPLLHARASQWFEAHGLIEDAIKHTLAAHDIKRAVELIEQVSPVYIKQGEIVILQRWLAALPDEAVHASPRLCISMVWTVFIASRIDQFIFWVDAAEQALHAHQQTLPFLTVAALQGEIVALRAMYTIGFNDFSEIIAICHQALQHLPAGNLYPRGLLLLMLGLASFRSMNVEAGSQALTEAIRSIQATGHTLLYPYVLILQAELYLAQGYPVQAEKLCQQLLTLASEQNVASFFAAGTAHLGLGCLFWEWNNLEAARQHLLQAWELGKRTQTSSTLTRSAWLLAQISQARGEREEAIAWFQQMEACWASAGSLELFDYLATCRTALFLAEGRLEEPLLWMQERHHTLEDATARRSEFDALTQVRVLIAAGRAFADASYVQRALRELEHLRVAAETAGRVRSLVEILALQALALHLEQDSTSALCVLNHAVSLAEPGRYMRVFVGEGEPMSRLLRCLLDQQRTQKIPGQRVGLTYLSSLLKAFTHPGTSSLPTSPTEGQPLLDPLSWREREVLRLLAAGRKNREIADELVVTIGTIKTHITTVYQKLGVSNRVQAVVRARSLGLL